MYTNKINNGDFQKMDLSDNDIDDDYGDDYNNYSDDDVKIELTDCNNGNTYVHTYTIPFKFTRCNEKKLICFSTINNENCGYGTNCTYAHSLEQQIIDEDRKFLYQIILDKNLMNFFSMTNPKTEELYKQLLFLTHICSNCMNGKCTGGYNCRNGANNGSLKICKNDLLTGECLNKLIDINVDPSILEKINTGTFEQMPCYSGCLNGHHLTQRNLMPYYKYVHQKESSKKNQYQSVRYIDINSLNKLFRNEYNHLYNNLYNGDSDSSTDEEINSLFQKKCDSDDESFL